MQKEQRKRLDREIGILDSTKVWPKFKATKEVSFRQTSTQVIQKPDLAQGILNS